MKNFLLLLLLTIASQLVFAQPDTEVHLMDLRRSSEGLVIEKPINISSNEGYDNQPSFWSDGESVLYARNVEGQTEIARYYLGSGNTMIITNTFGGSEYSPTLMPDGRISSIRLDTTGLQLLYAYTFRGLDEVLVPDLKIGYHAWINSNEIVAFVLGEPATMQIINTRTNTARIVGENIGRSLHKIPGSSSFSYLDKSAEQWVIKSMNPETDQSAILTPAIERSEDYCWTPKEEIIMGSGSKLYVWKRGSEWLEFADLKSSEITNITRLSASPDGKKLVVVSD
ncbi:TolB family protein [Ekhidna sp. To15]|uniref:TolB family protein n=1 Tax=Ekhidna sp. To15 TaxID=3395267 RepID=UPI003F521CE5